MAISGYFFNALKVNDTYDRIYNAEDVTSYLDKIVGNGVFPNPSSQLQVAAGGGMSITVNAGQGWIDGHKMINSAALPLTLAASDVLLNRIDRVIFYVDYTAREMGIEVKQGTPATNAVAPDLVRDATRYEMGLATVAVGKGVSSVSQANITDTRGDSTVCGFVQGLVQQADTSTLFNQWDAAGAQQIASNQAAWSNWFDQVKDELATVTLLQKLEQVFTTTAAAVNGFNVTDYIPNYKYTIDILEVYVNGLRLNENEYALNQSTVTLATPITHAGTEVGLVVYKSIDGSDAETIVDQVERMQATVDALATGTYIATGTDDNKKLSTIVQNFLNGGNDYQQLRIDVYGTLGITEPASTVNNNVYWFNFWSSASTTRRVIIDFANCDRIILDNTGKDSARFVSTTDNVEIYNAQVVMNNCTNAQMLENDALCTNCAFWLNEVSGGTGTLIGATRGKLDNCRMSVTAGSGKAYGFSADGGTLRLTNCEVMAYNASGGSNESVAVQVQGGMTANVLMMTNCRCPITARSGYKQDNVVKINSGKYALVGNALGMAATKYSTGDGMTELATILI
jgi:hypothetical protein